MGADNGVTSKPDRTALWGAAKWLGKVLAGAALGGATAAFTAYSTFMGMQNDVKAHGATIRTHTVQIEALQASDAAQAIASARADERANADRERNKEQLSEIRADLQFLQRQLIGRTRQ